MRILSVSSWAMLALAIILSLVGVIDAGPVLHRVWPVLAFLLLIKLASDLIEALGVFDLASLVLARVSRGSVALLYAGFCLTAAILTAVLSLDATVVLMTPVAITLARRLHLPSLPFLVATIWIANIGSLVLPISNLTNLLAVQKTRWSVGEFMALLGPVQLVLLAVMAAALVIIFRRVLATSYDMLLVRGSAMGPSLTIAGATILAILLFAAAVVAGVEPWITTAILDLVLLVLRAIAALKLRLAPTAFVRASRSNSFRLLRQAPWTMAAFALGLFLLIDPLAAIIATKLGPLVSADSFGSLLGMSALGSVSASLTNNLPAFLALEPSALGEPQLAALLVGVNAGPILTPWGSLATLLWLGMCAERGEPVSVRRFLAYSVTLVPFLLLAATAVLAWA